MLKSVLSLSFPFLSQTAARTAPAVLPPVEIQSPSSTSSKSLATRAPRLPSSLPQPSFATLGHHTDANPASGGHHCSSRSTSPGRLRPPLLHSTKKPPQPYSGLCSANHSTSKQRRFLPLSLCVLNSYPPLGWSGGRSTGPQEGAWGLFAVGSLAFPVAEPYPGLPEEYSPRPSTSACDPLLPNAAHTGSVVNIFVLSTLKPGTPTPRQHAGGIVERQLQNKFNDLKRKPCCDSGESVSAGGHGTEQTSSGVSPQTPHDLLDEPIRSRSVGQSSKRSTKDHSVCSQIKKKSIKTPSLADCLDDLSAMNKDSREKKSSHTIEAEEMAKQAAVLGGSRDLAFNRAMLMKLMEVEAYIFGPERARDYDHEKEDLSPVLRRLFADHSFTCVRKSRARGRAPRDTLSRFLS
nr:unnamed protein product [Digitaria exilis]